MREVVEFSTCFTRGWIFQELIFLHRIPYFTPERTYFCCGDGNWSENCPFDESIPSKVYDDYPPDDDPKLGFDFSVNLIDLSTIARWLRISLEGLHKRS